MSISIWLGSIVRQKLAGIVDVSDERLKAMEQHYELLLRWNSRMNLTTVTELHEAAVRHYCESVFLTTVVDGGSVVDIGSGAGFPGIPMAIARWDWRFDLVEAHQRKAVFLREAARGLENVRVICARAETVSGSYDWMVSRAVDPRALVKLKVARRFALLIGAEDASRIPVSAITPLPWGNQRVVAVGTF